MPLRALFNNVEIHSYEFDALQWQKLKQEYKKQNLIMACCGQNGIPKVSKLNNFYFAHKSRSDCLCAKESAEHLYLKFLIARIAHESGWDVTTEKQGETQNGETWIADVFCTKNKAKLAFEVQISQQSDSEFEERQSKYITSGIRALWLRKLRKRSEQYGRGIYRDPDLPVFGLRQNENGDFYLPQFGVSVEEFITGVFNKKLSWAPKTGETLIAKMIPGNLHCWRCKKLTGVITGLSISNSSGVELCYLPFSYDDAKELINDHADLKRLASLGIGAVKPRYSKTVGASYLSNGCIHCDAIMGDFFLHDAETGNTDNGCIEFKFINNGAVHLENSWLFDGRRPKLFF
jgi:hypothetical protein